MSDSYELNTASFEIVEISSSLKVSGSAKIDFTGASYVSGTFFGSGKNLTSVTASFIELGSNTTSSYSITSSFSLVSGNSSGTTLFTGSTYQITASWSKNSLTASYSIFSPKTKTGAVSGSAFLGNPRVSTVTFSSPFPNDGYSIIITGESVRTFTADLKTTSSFVINTNAKGAITNLTYWAATSYGEYN